jgi:hypothetical protein
MITFYTHSEKFTNQLFAFFKGRNKAIPGLGWLGVQHQKQLSSYITECQ